MDAKKLTYTPASFDMVIDKGTLDSVLVSCFMKVLCSVETVPQPTRRRCWPKFIVSSLLSASMSASLTALLKTAKTTSKT